MDAMERTASLPVVALTALACLGFPATLCAQSSVRGWGAQVFDTIFSIEHSFVEVDGGGAFYGGVTVARRVDGSVVAWGDNTYGQCNVPPLPAGLTYVEVAAAGYYVVLARRSDGSVIGWGDNY